MQAYSVFWAHLFTTTSQPFPTHINASSSLQILAHGYPCLIAFLFALFCYLLSVTTIVRISLVQSYPQEHRGLTRQWLLLPQRAAAAYSTQGGVGSHEPSLPTTWVHCAAVMLSPGPCFTPLLINIWLFSFLDSCLFFLLIYLKGHLKLVHRPKCEFLKPITSSVGRLRKKDWEFHRGYIVRSHTHREKST